MPSTGFEIKEILVWIIVVPLAWVWNKLSKLQDSHSDHRTHVAETYVQKEDLKDIMRPLREDLKYIREKLDG